MPRPQRQSIRSLIEEPQVPAGEQPAAQQPTVPGTVAPVVVVPPAESREPVVTQTASTQEQPAEEVERKKTGFTLRVDLLKEIKHLAVEEEVDINTLLEEGMQLLLNSRKHA